MPANVMFQGVATNASARVVLNAAAGLWLLVAAAGQWAFAGYVGLFYGGAAVRGDLGVWKKVLTHGYVAGDALGNLAIGVHLLLAWVLLVGGPLQFVGWLRARVPMLHRWNGRVYLLAAVVASLSGAVMLWTRGTVGGTVQHVAISLNAVLIVACAAMAFRHARRREFGRHRRWALRLFMVVSGVWFFRIGLMLWLFVHQAPVGFDPDRFEGPFLDLLAFAQFLVPLAVAEAYFRVQDRAGVAGRAVMAASLVGLTVAMGIGAVVAALGMWLPHL